MVHVASGLISTEKLNCDCIDGGRWVFKGLFSCKDWDSRWWAFCWGIQPVTWHMSWHKRCKQILTESQVQSWFSTCFQFSDDGGLEMNNWKSWLECTSQKFFFCGQDPRGCADLKKPQENFFIVKSDVNAGVSDIAPYALRRNLMSLSCGHPWVQASE